jgi:ABC-type uncharacterized transport system substrate-binding protein
MVKKTIFMVAVILLSFTTWSFANDYKGKKILFVNSYHEGYEWSDGVTGGILSVLNNTDIELKIVLMDTKRNTSEDFKKKAGLKAKKAIEDFKPDVVIASDDNAFKYVIMPYYRDVELPVVFCGLNWDAALYDAPYTNTTGMIEVALIPQLVKRLKQYSRGDKIGYLAADVLTSRKEANYYKKLFNLTFREKYIKTFEQWKAAFSGMQREADMLIVGNCSVIKDWDHKAAKLFAEEHTKIPTGTIDSWMMPYSLIGLTKVEKEQGEWAAKTALKILDGIRPSDIPLVRNKEGKLMLNLRIADRLEIVFSPSMLRYGEIVDLDK